jgi:UDP-GlcNAc:undecaprenyl-phosphate/decaprenyl-phosphate GlcNAc-1-phosphate transferase
MPPLLALLTAFGVTVILVPLVGHAARGRGFYPPLSDDRWRRRLVPNIGGVAMVPSLLCVSAVAGLVTELWPVLVTSALMFAVGLIDDFRTLRPATKLVLQMMAAAAFLVLAPPVHVMGNATADLLFGFVWIVGITNAVNLLDNMDGLAAGVVAIAAASFVLVLWLEGTAGAGPLVVGLAALIGVALGFLLFNFHPASIFMGDSGSHLLGSYLAGIALLATPIMTSRLAPVTAIPVVLLLIPIFDMVFVMLTRGLSGRSPFLGARDHTSHRLVALGIGEGRAVLVLYALTVVGGVVSIALLELPPRLAFGCVGLYVATLGVVGVYLGHVRVSRGGEPASAPLLTEVTSRNRIYEVLLDALLVAGAYYLAFIGRFRDAQVDQFVPYFTRSVPLVVGVQLATLWLCGTYRHVGGAFGARQLLGLAGASVAAVAASVIAVFYMSGFEGDARWVFAYDAVLAPALVVVARVAQSALDDDLRLRRSRGRTALVYGAGSGGALAVREMLQNPAIGLTPIGFIDDDPGKRRLRLEGVPVIGSIDTLPALLDRRPGHVTALVVGIANLSRDRLDQVCEICATRGVTVRRFRFDLEEIRHRAHPRGVVRFPGA